MTTMAFMKVRHLLISEKYWKWYSPQNSMLFIALTEFPGVREIIFAGNNVSDTANPKTNRLRRVLEVVNGTVTGLPQVPSQDLTFKTFADVITGQYLWYCYARERFGKKGKKALSFVEFV